MPPRSIPKASILVIDDEQIVHESVQRILEDEGYEVEGAFRVDEALQKLRSRSYDLVLTDLMMPDRNGMEAVEAIAKDHPNTGVVMFTGFATVDSAVQSMKLGALDYLLKPFTPDELLEVLERSLEQVRKTIRDREIEKTYAEAETAMRSSLDLKEILHLICTSVAKLFNVKGSSVLLYDRSHNTLEVSASYGLSDEYLQKGILDSSKSIPLAMQTGESIYLKEEAFDSELHYPDAARKEGIGGIVSIPLKVKETILGFLRIYCGPEQELEADHLDLAKKFAEQAARALENAIAYTQVRNDIEAMKKSIPGTIAKRMEAEK